MRPTPPIIAHVNEIASVASTLAGEQRRRGMSVTVMDPAKPGARLPSPWKLAVAPLRVPALAATTARIAIERTDLVHVHYATQAIVGRLARRPYVVHCHGTDVRGLDPRSALGRWVGAMLRPAALVLYSTPDLGSDVARFRSDAVFLPNPIDVERFSPSGSPDRDVLLGVKLDAVKGADIAIEAVYQLLVRRPGTTVTVIGSGPLTGLARQRLGDRALFVESIPHDQMAGLLRRHRVTLGQFRLGILSQFELEAMATGLALVTEVRYPNPQALAAPVLRATSPEQVAERLEGLLADESACQSLALAGRRWVVDHHGVAAVVDQLDRLYRPILDR